MYTFITKYAALAASLAATAHALNGVVAPGAIAADSSFQVTFQDGNSDKYRVYLAAALAGANGPTCYLENSTTLSSPTTLTIPASVGPSADYYSIAIADLTTSEGATYSNRFNFTGGTGNYTAYESHLGGAPFWNANDLPCSAYACARVCAMAGYPDDLTSSSAEATMQSCILKCPGVTPSETTSSTSSSMKVMTTSAKEAVVTLGPGNVMTAIEEVVTTGGSKITEAVIGSATLTLGGAAATISGKAVSLASTGVVVGGSSTVALSSGMATVTVTAGVEQAAASATGSSSSTATPSSGAASKKEIAIAGLVGVVGIAAFAL